MFGLLFYPLIFAMTYYCFANSKCKEEPTESEKSIEFLKNGLLVYALSKTYPDDFNGEKLPELVKGLETSIQCLEYIVPEFEHAQEHNDKIYEYINEKFSSKDKVYDFFDKFDLKIEKGISPKDTEEYEAIEKTITDLEHTVEDLKKKTKAA